jgi:hypothetical protein
MIFKDKYGRVYASEELDEMSIDDIERLSFHMEEAAEMEE